MIKISTIEQFYEIFGNVTSATEAEKVLNETIKPVLVQYAREAFCSESFSKMKKAEIVSYVLANEKYGIPVEFIEERKQGIVDKQKRVNVKEKLAISTDNVTRAEILENLELDQLKIFAANEFISINKRNGKKKIVAEIVATISMRFKKIDAGEEIFICGFMGLPTLLDTPLIQARKELYNTASEPVIAVVENDKLSTRYEKRFVVVNKDTGEILDDAQGYGYKTAQKAHAAWSYKNRDKSKDNKIKRWLKQHKNFARAMDTFSFEIAKGSWGPDVKFNTAFVKKMLDDNNLHPDFTAGELLRIWRQS